MNDSNTNSSTVVCILKKDSNPHSVPINQFLSELEKQNVSVLYTDSIEEATTTIKQNLNISSVIIDEYYVNPQNHLEHDTLTLIKKVHVVGPELPIFLILNTVKFNTLPLELIENIHEVINSDNDTALFIADRIIFATKNYLDNLLPPYFKALKNFTTDSPYYWDCPGHQGGVAYLKHPIGKQFIDFFGENIMRADIGIATPQMGDWLEHKGAPGQSEKKAAKIFGSDMTFYVTNGSSQSNQIVGHSMLQRDQYALVDRNCHKSVDHELTITGVKPVYFKPSRNGYGIIGLIPPEQFNAENIKNLIADSPLAKEKNATAAVAIVTNCTYDGVIYNVDHIAEKLADSVPRIQFDEAWYAYAKFSPLYQGRFAMGVPKTLTNLPTIYAVQSTHKMLAAFSSASMIHIRNSARAPVEKDVFNESFMMHGTTSPFYPIIASIDVATAMMEGDSGKMLLNETILHAIHFRKAMVNLKNKLKNNNNTGWFFSVWQPEKITVDTETVNFENVPDDILLNDPACWVLKSDEQWHGFGKLTANYAMLDPIKITLTCPGMNALGKTDDFGIPAPIVAKYLNERRIIVARNGEYNLLFLCTLGTTNGKWQSLVNSLLEFKQAYDINAPLQKALPQLALDYPCYRDMGLADLCTKIHKASCDLNISGLADAACEAKITPELSPSEAYAHLISNETELVKIADIRNRLVGVMVTPYPPGIPLVMPGERITDEAQPIIDYLLALQKFDRQFPGFEHELQGIEIDEEGVFWVRCIKE